MAEAPSASELRTDEGPLPRLLAQQIQCRQPLILPWHRYKTVRLGTLFHTSRHNTPDPWANSNTEDSPFDLLDLARVPKRVDREIGGRASYQSHHTATTAETRDHLALGFTAGVGLPFLAEVSVKGTYDSDVQNNEDADKTSLHSSIRAGTVMLARQPNLTMEAAMTLKYGGGLHRFKERYGDYYLAAYRFGGDTALLISGSTSQTAEKENVGITVTVDVLLVETSETWNSAMQKFSNCSSLRLIGYDTLDARSWNCATANREGPGGDAFQAQAEELITRAQALADRVEERLDELDVLDGDELDFAKCDELTAASLVVELILLPVGNLREVMRWKLNDDAL
ncbi:uncharacterized protein BO97DRAFT_195415 [Aspergillus homomorphus CBS 101889]|uniref:Uncharacterized protein n=1 Tax=Aspergillus homomorphus (strain CBS 101889) TaxID=1450537 RepID=A0A395HLN2_ASPHC|nr:hypothetical protein BO97DRAFT_195415 [Aspergillus homomorphus CBS 101889]RAL08767.1 hypothetical protein BO97DRAFT_195415 [Aspergillus homomorphus CBS 101889]